MPAKLLLSAILALAGSTSLAASPCRWAMALGVSGGSLALRDGERPEISGVTPVSTERRDIIGTWLATDRVLSIDERGLVHVSRFEPATVACEPLRLPMLLNVSDFIVGFYAAPMPGELGGVEHWTVVELIHPAEFDAATLSYLNTRVRLDRPPTLLDGQWRMNLGGIDYTRQECSHEECEAQLALRLQGKS